MKVLIAAVGLVLLGGCGLEPHHHHHRHHPRCRPGCQEQRHDASPGGNTGGDDGRSVSRPGQGGTPAPPQTPGTPEAPDPPDGYHERRAVLRLRGVGIGDYTSLRLGVRAVEVWADGRALAVELEGEELELTRAGHAWKVASFVIPPGVREVEIALRLDDEGRFADRGDVGVLDLRGPPIRFSAPERWFAENGHAVVHLDLTHSISPLPEGRLLLPNLQVHY